MNTDQTVAVLGLGAMGLPMATRLASTFQVRGYDISDQRLTLATDAGITPAESAQAAAEGAHAVLLAVRNNDQLNEALYGTDGVATVLAAGAVVILTSTVGVDAVRETATRLEKDGLHLVDAPVSGGPTRAGTGELLIVAGASDSGFEAAQPILQALASTLERMGPNPGDGQAMKTVNQLLCGVHIAAGAEALALAGSLGLDQAQVLRTLGAGAAQSFMLDDRGPRMLQAYDEDGAEVRSRLDIFVKDMGIVSRAAQDTGLPTPVAAAAEQLYLIGKAQGLSAEDDSSVITVVTPKEK